MADKDEEGEGTSMPIVESANAVNYKTLQTEEGKSVSQSVIHYG